MMKLLLFILPLTLMFLSACSGKSTKIEFSNQYDLSDRFLLDQYPIKLNLVFDVSQPTALTFPGKFGIKFSNVQGDYLQIAYNNELTCFTLIQFASSNNQLATPLLVSYSLKNKLLDWQIELNKSTIVFYADENKVTLTDSIYSDKNYDKIELFADTGLLKLELVNY